MAFSLITTAVRTFLISSPSAGSNLIRHTSPLRGVGFVVIQFFLAEGFKAGQFLVSAVVFFGHRRRSSQNSLSLLTRHPPQLAWRPHCVDCLTLGGRLALRFAGVIVPSN